MRALERLLPAAAAQSTTKWVQKCAYLQSRRFVFSQKSDDDKNEPATTSAPTADTLDRVVERAIVALAEAQAAAVAATCIPPAPSPSLPRVASLPNVNLDEPAATKLVAIAAAAPAAATTPQSAPVRRRSPPRFRPLPIPDKFDNDRAELLRANAHYASELLALRAKLARWTKATAEATAGDGGGGGGGGAVGDAVGDEKEAQTTADDDTKADELAPSPPSPLSPSPLPSTGELDELEQHLRALADEMNVAPAEASQRLAAARRARDVAMAETLALRSQLTDANNELQIYRREPRADARAHWADARKLRSRSSEAADEGSTAERHWKQQCGTSYREVNRLRRAYDEADGERVALRYRLTVARGELELARAAELCAAERVALADVDASSVPDLQIAK